MHLMIQLFSKNTLISLHITIKAVILLAKLEDYRNTTWKLTTLGSFDCNLKILSTSVTYDI